MMCEHRDKATEGGEHEFCFDNSFSHYSDKTVFFQITVSDKAADTDDMIIMVDGEELLPFDITPENFKVSLSYFHPENCWQEFSQVYDCMQHLSLFPE